MFLAWLPKGLSRWGNRIWNGRHVCQENETFLGALYNAKARNARQVFKWQ